MADSKVINNENQVAQKKVTLSPEQAVENKITAKVSGTGKTGGAISISFTSILILIGLTCFGAGSSFFISQWIDFKNSTDWDTVSSTITSDRFGIFWNYYVDTWLATHGSETIWVNVGPTIFIALLTVFAFIYIPLGIVNLIFVAQYLRGDGRHFKMTAGMLGIYSNLAGGIVILCAKPAKVSREELSAWINKYKPAKQIADLIVSITNNEKTILEDKNQIIDLKNEKAAINVLIGDDKNEIEKRKHNNENIKNFINAQGLSYKHLLASHIEGTKKAPVVKTTAKAPAKKQNANKTNKK